MDGTGPLDLLALADGENSVVVQVSGRYRPGVLPWHDHLAAEIVVGSGFVHGRLETVLTPADLDYWERALGDLRAGRDVVWLGDRAPELRIGLSTGDGVAEIEVADTAQSMTSARVPVTLAAGWVDRQAALLAGVRRRWPGEVVQTAPNTYAWR